MNDKTQPLQTWEAAVQWLRQQPDQQELIHACFYDDPLIEAAERFNRGSEWQAIKRELPPKKGTVLDIGAGRGISSYAFAKEGWQVTALEPDPSAIVGANAIRSLAAEAGLQIEVLENAGESLPFPDASFDVIHARQVLHHARDLQQLCLEAARVLKQGGLFIATREHIISRRQDLAAFLSSHPLHEYYGGENAYLLKEYKRAIQASGIELRKVLNPFQSDINLYPDTVEGVRLRFARKFRLPAFLIPGFLLGLLGACNKTPGRLYTFIGVKVR